jgi:hypothetical protein
VGSQRIISVRGGNRKTNIEKEEVWERSQASVKQMKLRVRRVSGRGRASNPVTT